MFKKSLAFILAIIIMSVPVLADISFIDIDASHWGYQSVNKLVNDGTVKGYEDGSFRPDNTVTRAEFVKMIGVGPERRTTDFVDVPSTHWGYEYIMTSGFDVSGDSFLPDKAITRGETIELLWKRGGSVTGIVAPKIITDQYSKNPDAVAWAYNHKIMLGDDGLSLRLDDSLSRVEAAALIIRARETDFNAPQADFKDSVNENILKTVFESYNLFDEAVAYNPSATVTNGEMSRAALRLAADEYNLLYSNYVATPSFEHEYAKDTTIIADRCIKKDYATAAFADAKAKVDDTVSAFAFAAIQKSNKLLSYGNTNNFYKDVATGIDSRKNVFLTFAYENGIQLKAGGSIGASSDVTHKDIAALLLQIDYLVGMETSFSTLKNEDGKFIRDDVKLNYNMGTYPANKDSFACIIAGIDNRVYEKSTGGVNPEGTYNFAREYGDMFMGKLTQLVSFMKKNYAMDVELVMYPNLVWDNGKGFSLRLLCKVISIDKPLTIAEVFGDTLIIPQDGTITAGSEYFIEITTPYTIFM